MTLFFDTSTPENASLRAAFDRAFETNKNACLGYISAAADLTTKNVSFMSELNQVAEIYKRMPLPSEANSSEEALKKLAEIVSLEAGLRKKAFAKCDDMLKGKAGDEAGINGIFNSMQTSAQQTTGRDEFRPINMRLMAAVNINTRLSR